MRKKDLSCLLVLGCILAGCTGSFGSEEVERPAVVEAETMPEYSVETVRLSSIEEKVNIYFQYKQAEIEEYSFDKDGILEGIYFRDGDTVVKGDLLASYLGYASASANLETYKSELETKNEKYDKLKQEMDFEIEEIDIKRKYGAISQEEYDKKSDKIHSVYDNDLAFLEDEIAILELRISGAEKDAEAGAIYADRSGTFLWGKDCYNIVGNTEYENFDAEWKRRIKQFNTASAGETVVKIASGEADFICTTEYSDYFKIGDTITLTSGDHTYQTTVTTSEDGIVVLSPASISDSMYVGMQINYELVVERKEAVKVVSKTCVHSSGDKNFVYVVGEDNLRRMVYVELGIASNTEVEIVSGLETGDVVVKR